MAVFMGFLLRVFLLVMLGVELRGQVVLVMFGVVLVRVLVGVSLRFPFGLKRLTNLK